MVDTNESIIEELIDGLDFQAILDYGKMEQWEVMPEIEKARKCLQVGIEIAIKMPNETVSHDSGGYMATIRIERDIIVYAKLSYHPIIVDYIYCR